MNSQFLKDVCATLDPVIVRQGLPETIWNQPIESGKAFEWVVLSSLSSEAKRRGLRVSYPLLESSISSGSFELWNIIPMHYTGKVGHAFGRIDRRTLASRFYQALVPKLVIYRGNTGYSVFREGFPYHMIALESIYDERPDILVVDGTPAFGYPRIVSDNQYVEFVFSFHDGTTFSGTLQVINSSLLPIEDKNPREMRKLPIRGIIECSVNKTQQTADAQLRRYQMLFSNLDKPRILLVTGNRLEFDDWDTSFINIFDISKDELLEQLRRTGSEALRLFSII